MGYTFLHSCQTKDDVVAYLTSGQEFDSSKTNVIIHSLKGSVLYLMVDTAWKDSNRNFEGNVHLFIVCLLEQTTNEYGGKAWGFKMMDETAEPYYYDCPVAWIKTANRTVAEMYPSAMTWRRTVLVNHATQAVIKQFRAELKAKGMNARQIDDAINVAKETIQANVAKDMMY